MAPTPEGEAAAGSEGVKMSQRPLRRAPWGHADSSPAGRAGLAALRTPSRLGTGRDTSPGRAAAVDVRPPVQAAGERTGVQPGPARGRRPPR